MQIGNRSNLPASEWSEPDVERCSAEELAPIKEIEAGKDSPYLKNVDQPKKKVEHVGGVRIN